MKQTLSTQGLILRTAPTSESFLKIDVLCPENGVQLCLKRISKKQPQKDSPELFDTAELTLENSKQGTFQFISEYRVANRRVAIGNSYRTLKYTSDFCALIAKNGPHMADSENLYLLTERTLDAMAEGKAPSLVYLKAIYLLLKDEGYPVKELWWASLSSELRKTTRDYLNQPAPDKLEKEHVETVEHLNHRLNLWLRNETDLQLPASITL
jgi:recombinational DNA repair protein (RecF pathway)